MEHEVDMLLVLGELTAVMRGLRQDMAEVLHVLDAAAYAAAAISGEFHGAYYGHWPNNDYKHDHAACRRKRATRDA